MKNLFLICFLLFFAYSCKEKIEINQESKGFEKSQLPQWAANAVIYKVNTLQFSPDGDFAGIEAQLDRLKNMGVDILCMMPIHPVSELKRKANGDVRVSKISTLEEGQKKLITPYAVADYRDANMAFGGLGAFKSLVEATHAKGMKIIIDWVPNQTGWDNTWISDHSDWYTKDSLGNIISSIDYNSKNPRSWTDVASLNYDNRNMRQAMIDAMVFWLTDIDIDGFCVKIAHSIPQKFWDEWAPVMLRAKPKAFLLAQSELPSHRNKETYHATYGSSFHHLTNLISRGEQNAAEIHKWLEEDRKKFNTGFHVHFTSNNDEKTQEGRVFDFKEDGHKALAVLSCTFDGMPLMYSGQEEVITKRLSFYTKEYIGFEQYAYAEFFQKLFELKDRNKALWNGKYGGKLTALIEHDHVIAFERKKNGDKVTVILNLSNDRQSFTIPKEIKGKELFENQSIHWNADTALGLEPWQYYVIEN